MRKTQNEIIMIPIHPKWLRIIYVNFNIIIRYESEKNESLILCIIDYFEYVFIRRFSWNMD